MDQSGHKPCPCRYNCCTLWWCTNYTTPQFQPRAERTSKVVCKMFFFLFCRQEKKKFNSFNNLPRLAGKIHPTHLIENQVNYWATCTHVIHGISSLSTAPFNSLDTQEMRNYHMCSQSIIQTSNCTDYKSANNDPLFTKQRWLIKLPGLKLNIALKIIKKEIKEKKKSISQLWFFLQSIDFSMKLFMKNI